MSEALSIVGWAQRVLRRAGYNGSREPDGIGELAVALLGDEGVRYASPPFAAHSRLRANVIFVRPDLDDASTALAIANRLSEWWLARESINATANERDDLAATLLVLPQSLRRARDRYGDDVCALAEHLVCPPWVIRYVLRDELVERDRPSLRLVAC